VPPVTLATAWVNFNNGGTLRTGRFRAAALADFFAAAFAGALGDAFDDTNGSDLLNTLIHPTVYNNNVLSLVLAIW
jgi:hypothetical protein